MNLRRRRILFTVVSSSPSSLSKFSTLSSISSEELSSISTDLLQERQSKAINEGLTSTLLETFMDLLQEMKANGLGTMMATDERLMSSALFLFANLLSELLSMVTSSTLMISMDLIQELKATTSTLLEFLTDLLHELDLESTMLKLKGRKNRLNLFVTPLRRRSRSSAIFRIRLAGVGSCGGMAPSPASSDTMSESTLDNGSNNGKQRWGTISPVMSFLLSPSSSRSSMSGSRSMSLNPLIKTPLLTVDRKITSNVISCDLQTDYQRSASPSSPERLCDLQKPVTEGGSHNSICAALLRLVEDRYKAVGCSHSLFVKTVSTRELAQTTTDRSGQLTRSWSLRPPRSGIMCIWSLELFIYRALAAFNFPIFSIESRETIKFKNFAALQGSSIGVLLAAWGDDCKWVIGNNRTLAINSEGRERPSPLCDSYARLGSTLAISLKGRGMLEVHSSDREVGQLGEGVDNLCSGETSLALKAQGSAKQWSA
nr:hypothetical protein Iba_chr11aCG11450 [Ipomoea batatas]